MIVVDLTVKQVLAKLVRSVHPYILLQNTSKIEIHVEKVVKELTKHKISWNYLKSWTNVKNCWTTRGNAEHRIKPRYVRLICIRLIKSDKSEKATNFLEIVSTVDIQRAEISLIHISLYFGQCDDFIYFHFILRYHDLYPGQS